jgi:hypothetical protein
MGRRDKAFFDGRLLSKNRGGRQRQAAQDCTAFKSDDPSFSAK